MRFPLTMAGLEAANLSVDSGTWRDGPTLLSNGQPLGKDATGRTIVRAPNGRDITILVRRSPWLIDPVPRVEVDGTGVTLAPPLRWSEIVWSALPLGLAFIGGTLGAAIGAVAALANLRIMRGPGGQNRRFARSALVTLGALSLLAVVVVASMNLAQTQAREAANDATQRFHAQLDDGRCTQIYDESAAQFRNITSQVWVQTCEDLRTKAGHVVTSTLRDIRISELRSPSPTATYAEATYLTVYVNATVQETFVWVISDSPPRLAGYHAESQR